MELLRRGLLDGRAIALAPAPAGPLAQPLVDLGARVEELVPASVMHGDEERVGDWAREHAPLDVLVYDARGQFGAGGRERLAVLSDCAWAATREVAVGALIPAEAPGKVVLIGPSGDAGELAEAARAGLENLARTLSIEWARYGVTTTMLAPGPATAEAELAELVCFLCSPAAEYISGARIELDLLARPARSGG